MINSKTYLNVPFAQKDEAKVLGAKWDPANKKWYVPANIDMTLFARWQLTTLDSSTAKSSPASRTASKNAVLGVVTHAKDKDFVAYNGEQAPWD